MNEFVNITDFLSKILIEEKIRVGSCILRSQSQVPLSCIRILKLVFGYHIATGYYLLLLLFDFFDLSKVLDHLVAKEIKEV